MNVCQSEKIDISMKGFSDVADITSQVEEIVAKFEMKYGLVTVFCPGSTGSVTTIEFESGVVEDLKRALERIVPSNISYAHDRRWGDGNGFSHVRAAIMKPSLAIPVANGELTLGTWQQIVFIDFDNRPRKRSLVVQLTGTK